MPVPFGFIFELVGWFGWHFGSHSVPEGDPTSKLFAENQRKVLKMEVAVMGLETARKEGAKRMPKQLFLRWSVP